jgi:hypothetical protein
MPFPPPFTHPLYPIYLDYNESSVGYGIGDQVGNCGLTVIRYRRGSPGSYGDQARGGNVPGGDAGAVVAVADAHRLRLIRLPACNVPQAPMEASALVSLLERRGALAAVWPEAD